MPQRRQGALAGVNDVLSDAGKNALNKAQHRTAGLTTTQLSVLIAGILVLGGLVCFGLWWCCGARAQRKQAREERLAAQDASAHRESKHHGDDGETTWMRFDNDSRLDSSTSLNRA
ncbi:hypothetical protein V8E36_005305 [Tilletia maclaganii]